MVKIKTNATVKNKPKAADGGKSSNGKKMLLTVLVLLFAGGGVVAYLNFDRINELLIASGLEEGTEDNGVSAPPAVAEMPVAAASLPQSSVSPSVFQADPAAGVALNGAKLWVEARVAKGHPLFEINESLDLDAQNRQHWQSIQINQGTISAVHVNSTPDNPTILLPLLEGERITWVCAGAVPEALEEMCG